MLLSDRKCEVFEELGILATPAAFLIEEDGAMARDAAIGNDVILAFIRDDRGVAKEE